MRKTNTVRYAMHISIYIIITIHELGARAVPGNTSPRFFIQPELARAVWKPTACIIFLLTGLRIYTGEYKA